MIERGASSVRALEKTTGRTAWDTADTLVDEFFLSCDPVVREDEVLFAGMNRRTGRKGVFAVGSASGEDRWTLELTTNDEYFHGLSVSGERLCVLRRDNDTGESSVSAISIPERAVEWTHDVTAFDHVDRPVAVSPDAIVYGGYMEFERTGAAPGPDETDGGVVAVDPETGSELWRREIGGTQTPLTIYDGTVFATPDRGTRTRPEDQTGPIEALVALDLATGEVSWAFESTNSFSSSPAVTSERAYIGKDRSLLAIHRGDGTPEWKTSVGRFVGNAAPVVVGDAVLVGDLDFDHERSFVNAFDGTTGAKRWSKEVPEGAVIDAIGVDGAVFAKGETYHGTDSETIRAFW